MSTENISSATELERKVIEYYLAPHTLQETALVVLGHKCTKATSNILNKYAIAKHSKEITDALRSKTNLMRYGAENPLGSREMIKKRNETVQSKYGVNNVFQNAETKAKIKKTCLDKYGVDHYNKTLESKDKHRMTCLEKYGVDHYNKTAIGKNRYKITCLAKYGVANYTQTAEYKEIVKIKQDSTTAKQICTKRKNHTLKSSAAEIECLKKLQDIFGISTVFTQYKEERYPFLCDFYIQDLDLFIELNFTWTHGGKKFTESPEDLKKLAIWQQKALRSKYYQNAIETWTIRDLKKYDKAQINNLNYIAFYTKKDLNDWLGSLSSKCTLNS